MLARVAGLATPGARGEPARPKARGSCGLRPNRRGHTLAVMGAGGSTEPTHGDDTMSMPDNAVNPVSAGLGVGRIVRDGVSLFGRHAPAVMGIALPAAALLLLSEGLHSGIGAVNPMLAAVDPEQASNAAGDPPGAARAFGAVPAVVFGLIFEILAFAAIIHLVATTRDGGRVHVSTHLDVARMRFLPVAGAMLLMAVAIGVGAVLAIVPGFYMAGLLAVVAPVVVLEGKALGALRRGVALSRGYRWPLAGLFAVYLGLLLGLTLLEQGLHLALAQFGPTTLPLTAAGLVAITVETVMIAAGPILVTLAYRRLRAVEAAGAAAAGGDATWPFTDAAADDPAPDAGAPP
jgi:hypothetical protein